MAGERLCGRFALHDLTKDESTTCEAMLSSDERSSLLVMPTHHISEYQDMMGFRFDCEPFLLGSQLPLVRTMFHGHTVVECQAREEVILQLMSDPPAARGKMLEFLARVESDCVPATLDCIPENASSVTPSGPVSATGLLSVDSRHWTPEVPERIGVYHAYVRGFNRDARSHRLFLACSGGMSRASDAFCNLVIDAGRHWTAEDVCESEEAWWLRKGCQRSRCRLIKMLADEFGLKLNHIQDIQAYRAAQMAIPTTDTVEHDIARMSVRGRERVAVYNACADTTRSMNGVACAMHPSEGVWLFRGPPRGNCFGSMFGDYVHCGAFPTSAPRVQRPQSIWVQDAECVVRLRSKSKKESYMCFDEAYFKMLEGMQWNRDNGYVELMPIVVGVQ